MKIRKTLGLFTAVMMLTCSIPTMASSIELLIDGHKVQTSTDVKADERPDIEVAPQVINGVTMVPLRFISESMCATVDYKKPNIILTYGKDTLTLTLGKKTVTKNGQPTTPLNTAPYIKNSTTLVPLRFIGETFGAVVNYKNGKVTVDTPTVMYNGQKISSFQSHIRMTMGGSTNEACSNRTIEAVLAQFDVSPANEVAKPKDYTDTPSRAMDIDGCYLTLSYYNALDATGKDLFKYEIYQLDHNDQHADLALWLLHDTTTDKWYKCDQPNDDIGFWKQIFNNVV